tara:strand:- start:617 stop:1285 length:669 start_codon:yes stop_codon:yes gene_type:complete
MKFIKKRNEISLITEFIKIFKKESAKKRVQGGRLSFVLTGGSSPKKLYQKLASSDINWKNIDLFWGDERFVSKKSINSNYRLVYDNLLKKIKINNENIYPFITDKSKIKKTVTEYQKSIRRYFKKRKISFDIFLLGMGNDGHVASIFPKSKEIKKKFIVSYVNKKDFKRITLGMNIINNSKNIFLWLNTKEKTKIFDRLRKKDKSIPVNNLKKKKLICYTIN